MIYVDIDAIRSQIPVLEHTAYMNTGWSGPSPRRVAQAMKDRIDLELEQGSTTSGVYEAGREIQVQAREAAALALERFVARLHNVTDPEQGNALLSGKRRHEREEQADDCEARVDRHDRCGW